DSRARHLGRVVERAGREAMGRAGDLDDRLVGERDQPLVERDRLDAPDPLPLDVDVLLPREALARHARELEEARELRGVEMALVEELLRGLDDRRDDARLADDAAG